MDISDESGIFEAIRMRRPDFVVNCLVESGVDRAEFDPQECRLINHDLPVSLAIACREFDATLIQLSTDYIFDGQKDIAYFEDDAPNPLNLYGQTRLEAERYIENLLDRHIILRTSHLFAPAPNSFVANILDLARVESELSMIQDEEVVPHLFLISVESCRQLSINCTLEPRGLWYLSRWLSGRCILA